MAEPVEHELGDRSVPHQLGPAQNLQVPGDRGLRQVQHSLQVGDEEWGRRQAVEDPEPGGLRDRQQQVRGGSGAHMRVNEYTPRRMDGKGVIPSGARDQRRRRV